MTKKRYALIGAAGYVAVRHFKAIRDTGGELVAAVDISDSVGILDSYFPKCFFFTDMARFDRFLVKCQQSDEMIDFLVICTPNHMHDAHVRYGLGLGVDVICEKPVVLNPWNLQSLMKSEQNVQQKVFNILQLRLHPNIVSLKEMVDSGDSDELYDVRLTYLTSRGHWYYASWKGDMEKSGGIATNIGIHFFDMLIWIFGEVKGHDVHMHTHDRAGGYLRLKKANVKWFLSIDHDMLPQDVRLQNKRTFRQLSIAGEEYYFSDGFEQLHTASYNRILSGDGFELSEALPSITLTHDIRTKNVSLDKTTCHEMCLYPPSSHPFGL